MTWCRWRPGAAGSGIVFVRTDLGRIRIPALIAYAGPSFYATVLQKDGATVSTIEHLMAALEDQMAAQNNPNLTLDDLVAQAGGHG
jgi:UDP-3-O-acyl-N-acetylglucosamine deacetylase